MAEQTDHADTGTFQVVGVVAEQPALAGTLFALDQDRARDPRFAAVHEAGEHAVEFGRFPLPTHNRSHIEIGLDGLGRFQRKIDSGCRCEVGQGAASRWRTLVGIGGRQGMDPVSQSTRKIRSYVVEIYQRIVVDLPARKDLERMAAGQRGMDHGPQRKEVHPGVSAGALEFFRGQKRRSAGAGLRFADPGAETEIDELQMACRGHTKVGGRQVAMDEVPCVQESQAAQGLRPEMHHLVQGAIRRLVDSMTWNVVVQQKRTTAVRDPVFDHARQVRMVVSSQKSMFLAESFAPGGVGSGPFLEGGPILAACAITH